jgi:hypothetical protein
VDDAGAPVDVATFKRQPLLGPQAGQPDEHRQRRAFGCELGADRLELGDRRERGYLAALRFRVRHVGGDVLVDNLRPDRVVQHLAQTLVDLPRRPGGQAPPPRADLADRQSVDS